MRCVRPLNEVCQTSIHFSDLRGLSADSKQQSELLNPSAHSKTWIQKFYFSSIEIFSSSWFPSSRLELRTLAGYIPPKRWDIMLGGRTIQIYLFRSLIPALIQHLYSNNNIEYRYTNINVNWIWISEHFCKITKHICTLTFTANPLMQYT